MHRGSGKLNDEVSPEIICDAILLKYLYSYIIKARIRANKFYKTVRKLKLALATL